METFDAAVVGLGVMGSAAARELSRRGHRVIGLDRFGPGHERGGSHGESRLARTVYHEGPHYVPLLRRAYSAWRALEERTGERLLLRTGGLVMGPPEGELVAGSRRTARACDLDLEELDADELRNRFPAFRLPPGHAALHDPAAGVLRADRCLAALRAGAREAGARLRFRRPVRGWIRRRGRWALDPAADAAAGAVEADRLLVAAGGWTAELVERAELPLSVERQTVHWFRPGEGAEDFRPERFPVFLAERGGGGVVYGAPDLGTGVKAALHHGGGHASRPGELSREVEAADEAAVREAVGGLIPDLAPEPHRSRVCLYANSPDGEFVIDRLGSPSGPGAPGDRGPVVACGFSGHGFKFAPAVGEAAADMLEGAQPAVDLSAFRSDRWRR